LSSDDLWEEEHPAHLNFVDESCGSRVLISTRIRHLLADAFAVEIGKPSVEDSIGILMGAAELGGSEHAAPAEAREVVELCGRLPLALVMAGKLILELEVGSRWDGITSILRDELRGNEAASSREQGVIRASLAGLKGSERDTTGARQLFKLFGLVPEDTACPLECLQMMYDAVYETSKATSILHIRKWLKMLIDRSLVLGTVDRASLHDLVLDFTTGMYDKVELAGAHRRVIEMFRQNRPITVSAAGIAAWDQVRKRLLLRHFIVNIDHFAKTGLGQTSGNHSKRDACSCRSTAMTQCVATSSTIVNITVRRRCFLSHLYIKTNILPRLARDKRTRGIKNEGVFAQCERLVAPREHEQGQGQELLATKCC
jgi:hypothetical protein